MAKYISKNQIHKLISILMVISLIGTVSIILSGCTSKLSDTDCYVPVF
jgi:Na+-transporting NADH:ubiquinone oxidoreductase subunit NqrC